jgi:hypothetical protein
MRCYEFWVKSENPAVAGLDLVFLFFFFFNYKEGVKGWAPHRQSVSIGMPQGRAHWHALVAVGGV